MKPRKTWILIADGAHARIVESEGPASGLKAAMNHEFAASHAPSRDFVSDGPGRGHSTGSGQTHATESRVDRHEFEKELFAEKLAEVLTKADTAKAFDDLVLVAPPKTLGALRKALAGPVQGKITAELDKDLTHVAIHDLGAHLGSVIAL
jgi:protein required for attachment to host cells